MEDFTAWINEQRQRICDLKGSKISRVIAYEMALFACDAESQPQFEDPSVPFLQATSLFFELDGDTFVRIATYLNDHNYGLDLREVKSKRLLESDVDKGAIDRIYRARDLSDFPMGEIIDVQVSMDSWGDISSIHLQTSSGEFLLVAGAVDGYNSEQMDILLGREAILIYETPDDFYRLQFNSNGAYSTSDGGMRQTDSVANRIRSTIRTLLNRGD